jgi:hypothetical protein
VTKKKNPAAVALAKRRAAALTPERRLEISRLGNKVRKKKTTPEQRSAIAKKAAAARWGTKPDQNNSH